MTQASDRLVALSLIDRIQSGKPWTPEFFSEFRGALARGAPAFESPFALGAARALFAEDAATIEERAKECAQLCKDEDPTTIKASVLRAILRCAEEDEARYESKPPPSGARNASDTKGQQLLNGNAADLRFGSVLVSRFGVQIEDACICGYLNISGIKFERPLRFIRCIFTHTVNMSEAKLGPTWFSGCRFAESSSGAQEEYEAIHDGDSDRRQIGDLPALMRHAHGIFAAGSTFAGPVDLTGIVAQRLDFGGARIAGSAELTGAAISLPKGLEGYATRQNSATSLTTRRSISLRSNATILR